MSGTWSSHDLRRHDMRAPLLLTLLTLRGGFPRLLSLRGGFPRKDEGGEAGMTTALLEPSFVAAHLAKSRQAGGTRVGFADFSASESGAKTHTAKRTRRDPVEIGHSAEESRPVTRPSDKYSYDSMYENLVNPDRPGFLESLTVYPPYEPESDERAIDDEVVTNSNIEIISFLTAACNGFSD